MSYMQIWHFCAKVLKFRKRNRTECKRMGQNAKEWDRMGQNAKEWRKVVREKDTEKKGF